MLLFEARGYTAWDPTSPAFIKDGTLYIPTAFCSYSGEALDKRPLSFVPWIHLNKEAVKCFTFLGNERCQTVNTTVGPEQEYFLVDKDLYTKEKRPCILRTYLDLVLLLQRDRKWKIITSVL